MKSKRVLVITIIVLSLGLTSCSSFRSEVRKRDDDKIANTRFESILEALENNDKEGLKKMFSPNALKEANDIEGGIEYIMKFYHGKVISSDYALEASGSKSNGQKTSELKCYYTVTTEEDTYIVFFIDQIVDTKEPDNIGLYMLQIIKESDEDNEFDWGDKTRCAGIYRPTAVNSDK